VDNGIGDWVDRRALRAGGAIALVDAETGRRTNYDELARRTTALAVALCGIGMRRGERVASLMDNSVEFVELLFAVAKAAVSPYRSTSGSPLPRSPMCSVIPAQW
jgi:fatty-acyl-CoA synthase